MASASGTITTDIPATKKDELIRILDNTEITQFETAMVNIDYASNTCLIDLNIPYDNYHETEIYADLNNIVDAIHTVGQDYKFHARLDFEGEDDTHWMIRSENQKFCEYNADIVYECENPLCIDAETCVFGNDGRCRAYRFGLGNTSSIIPDEDGAFITSCGSYMPGPAAYARRPSDMNKTERST